MRLGDLEEAKTEKTIKARDPNWRDMEALRKSGAAGSHGDKTKTIPRKEKYKKISMETAPDELGPMNDKMKALLSKVHDDEVAQKQIDKERADAERQAKVKELGPKAMDDYITKLKAHDWTYQYSDDHRYWKKGSEEAGEIRRLQRVLDPNFEIYNKYAPEGFGVKMNKESMYEDQQENIVSMNVPLLIRVLEYAREDAESDVDLHNIIEKAVSMGNEEPLTMKDYDSLVQKDLPAPQEPEEIKKEHSDIFKALEKVEETASPGATSAGNIATVNNPHIAIGDKKTRKKYGSLVGASPNPPKAKMQKPSDNALDMKGTSIFGGPLKR